MRRSHNAAMGSVRSRSGLRNRHRSGQSTYSRKKKSTRADSYGAFTNGHRIRAERIAGTVIA